MLTKGFVRFPTEQILYNIHTQQEQEQKRRQKKNPYRKVLIINQYPKKRINREQHLGEIILQQNLAQLVAVKPNKKLINNKIQKYSPREIQ